MSHEELVPQPEHATPAEGLRLPSNDNPQGDLSRKFNDSPIMGGTPRGEIEHSGRFELEIAAREARLQRTGALTNGHDQREQQLNAHIKHLEQHNELLRGSVTADQHRIEHEQRYEAARGSVTTFSRPAFRHEGSCDRRAVSAEPKRPPVRARGLVSSRLASPVHAPRHRALKQELFLLLRKDLDLLHVLDLSVDLAVIPALIRSLRPRRASAPRQPPAPANWCSGWVAVTR